MYKIGNSTITRVTTIKDLGILIECNMIFSLHINTFITKTFKMFDFNNRNMRNLKNINSLKTLYFSLARIHLEFV